MSSIKGKRDLFIESVTEQIRLKEAKESIAEEMSGHIEERYQDFLEQGLSQEEAEEKAVSGMGNPLEIGVSLDKIHRPKVEWSVILSVIALSIIGVFVLINSSNISPLVMSAQSLIKSLAAMVVGLVIIFGFYHFHYARLIKFSWAIYLISFGLILFTQLFGSSQYGVKVLDIPLIGEVKPIHLCSLLFIVAFQGFLHNYTGQGIWALIKLGLAAAPSLFLLLSFPSFAATLITFMTYMILLTVVIVKKRLSEQRWPLLSLLYGSFFILVFLMTFLLKAYQRERLLSLFVGTENKSYTFHVIERLLNGAKPIGHSDFIGSNGFSALPGSNSEFAFTTIIATMGWIAAIGVGLLIGFFIVRIGLMTLKIKTQYGFYLSLAMVSMIGIKFVYSILSGAGFLNTAITGMPFVSYGLTDYIVNMVAIGLILSVWKSNDYMKPDWCKPKNTSCITYQDGKLVIDIGRKRGNEESL